MKQIENQNCFECVPNVSEGRDPVFLSKLKTIISDCSGIQLLHSDIGYDANRTVFTFVGNYTAIIETLKKMYAFVSQRLDMKTHSGSHPRIGAIDVCPVIPLFDTPLNLAVKLSHEIGSWVGDTLSIPVFLYEASASTLKRKNLANIRSGEYENLTKKLVQPVWSPDYGPSKMNVAFGATVIGARHFLIAYNININTKEVNKAKHIAARLRESGYMSTNKQGEKIRIPGACKYVKAIGWFMESYDIAQVSTNITNVEKTNLIEIYNCCKSIAAEINIELLGSELIGLIPKECLLKAGNFLDQELSDSEKIDKAIAYLGLDSIVVFDKTKRILENVLL